MVESIDPLGNGQLDLELLVYGNILYSLRREYNEQNAGFDYILHGSGPLIGHVDVNLDQNLGRTLANCWKQTENGAFLGRHNMEWILDCLTRGTPI